MKSSNAPRRLVALIGSMIAVMCSAACSVGSLGTGDQADGVTTITYLVFNEPSTVTAANALITAFEKDNPQTKVKLDTMPTGSDGDNVVKTRLSTGEMSDVFSYNSGSLLQAIRPDEYLVSLSDQSWVKDLDKSYLPAVSTAKGLYGAPTGGTTPGGVVYNKAVYAKLGLKIPKTWDQFRANLLIKKSGIATPVEQTFGDAWTAQLVILADFANIAAAVPQWAADYTANKARNVDQPALTGWQHLRQLHDDGLLNKDFGSATYDKGVQAIATGKAAHYPMLAGVIDAVRQNHPQYLKDIGMFAMPTSTGTDSHLTLFLPSGYYIPKTSTGAKLDAAKKFVAFTQTTRGCDLLVQSGSYGPFVNRLCKVPADAPAAIKELQTYVAAGNTGPALESVSPIKGPESAPARGRGRLGDPDGGQRREALRPEREAAGPAARAPGLVTTTPAPAEHPPPRRQRGRSTRSRYPLWFLLPGGGLLVLLFVVPTATSFYFSLTRWTLFDSTFIGLENYITFFQDPQLFGSFVHTLVYAVITSVGKVVAGLALAILLNGRIIARGYLRAVVFFPVLVSAVGVAITFKVLFDPFDGLINRALGVVGIDGAGWLTNPDLALTSVAMVDIWKGVGVSTLIFMAGLVAIPRDYYESAHIDGATDWQRFKFITLPLVGPATMTVVILNVISGLRSFELIWTMTGGGPGFTSEV